MFPFKKFGWKRRKEWRGGEGGATDQRQPLSLQRKEVEVSAALMFLRDTKDLQHKAWKALGKPCFQLNLCQFYACCLGKIHIREDWEPHYQRSMA